MKDENMAASFNKENYLQFFVTECRLDVPPIHSHLGKKRWRVVQIKKHNERKHETGDWLLQLTLCGVFQGPFKRFWTVHEWITDSDSFNGSIKSPPAGCYTFSFYLRLQKRRSFLRPLCNPECQQKQGLWAILAINFNLTHRESIFQQRQTALPRKPRNDSISCSSSCKSILLMHSLFLLKHTLSWGEKEEMTQITENLWQPVFYQTCT